MIAILVVAPWFLMVYQIDGSNKIPNHNLYVLESRRPKHPSPTATDFSFQFIYLIEMYFALQRHPGQSNLHTHHDFGSLRFGSVCLPKKKTRRLPANMVLGGLRFLHCYPGQAMALRRPVLFPILAISAASFLIFLYGKVRSWKPKQIELKQSPELRS